MKLVQKHLFSFVFLIVISWFFGCVNYRENLGKWRGMLPSLQSETDRFSFVVMGDSRSHPDIFEKLVRHISRLNPAFVVLTGDLITSGGKNVTVDSLLKEYEIQFNEPMQPLVEAGIPLYPVIGNHDVSGGNPVSEELYCNQFNLPGNERWYSFNYGNSHFVVLNSHEFRKRHKITAEQLEWLKLDLKTTLAENIFVFIHEPAYPVKNHLGNSLDKYPADRDTLWALMNKHSVDIFFAGHEHIYHRSAHDGLLHVITGGGGAPIKKWDEAKYGDLTNNAENVTMNIHHFIFIKVMGENINGMVYDIEGNIVDTFEVVSR
ncbi:MAG: metallophosphoesterase [Gemmatimonadota bacterium]|nr:MAG: metallophosphoesterase [Gemmatimonadota bacterium]